MSNATLSPASLAAVNDRIWAATGTLGYLLLLNGTLFSGTFTVNASSDVITTASAHGLVTGSRFRVSTTGVLPALSSGSLSASVDYYAIVLSSTTLQLATTLANAQAGSPVFVNFTDTGSGTHTLAEQRLNDEDPISVLVNKEITHPSYARNAVAALGAAVAVGDFGEKAPISFTYSITGSALVFRHVLFIRGGTSTIGNTTGTEPQLTTESADVSITAGAPKIVTLVFRTKNAA